MRARWRYGCFCWGMGLLLPFISGPFLARAQDFSPTSDSRIAEIYAQAKQAQGRGNYREAAEAYSAIVKLQPDAFEARINLGLMHHLLNEYAEAAQQFETVLRTNPKLFVPNLFLGLDLLQLEQPGRAVTYLERAHSLERQDVEPVLQLGRAYADLHQFEKANDWYLLATRMSPGKAEAWYGSGITYLHLSRAASDELVKQGQASVYARRLYAESLEERGWLGDAVTAYQKLLALPSAPMCAHAELGFVYLFEGKTGSTTEAKNQFEQALVSDAGCLLARLGMARVDFESSHPGSALKELTVVSAADSNFFQLNAARLWQNLDPATANNLENTIRNPPACPSCQSLRGILDSLEQSRKPGADISRVTNNPPGRLDGTPSDSPADLKQATATQLYRQGHYTRCAQKLTLRLGGSPPDDLVLLADCAYQAGDYGLSFSAASQLLKLDPHNLAALYWRVRGSQRMGFSALTRAGLADPDSSRMHLLLAEAYREKQSFSDAEAEYNKVLGIDPNYVPAHVGLAVLYWQERRPEMAITHSQAVLALKPGDPESSYVMGQILVERHAFSEALPYLNSALAGATAILPHVHALRSKVYAAQGKTEEAVSEIKQALDADPYGEYHYQLYRLDKTLGDEVGAKTALEQSEILRKRSEGEDPTNHPP